MKLLTLSSQYVRHFSLVTVHELGIVIFTDSQCLEGWHPDACCCWKLRGAQSGMLQGFFRTQFRFCCLEGDSQFGHLERCFLHSQEDGFSIVCDLCPGQLWTVPQVSIWEQRVRRSQLWAVNLRFSCAPKLDSELGDFTWYGCVRPASSHCSWFISNCLHMPSPKRVWYCQPYSWLAKLCNTCQNFIKFLQHFFCFKIRECLFHPKRASQVSYPVLITFYQKCGTREFGKIHTYCKYIFICFASRSGQAMFEFSS